MKEREGQREREGEIETERERAVKRTEVSYSGSDAAGKGHTECPGGCMSKEVTVTL